MSRLLFLLFSLLLLHVNALPVRRQGAPLPQPTTLQTTSTQNTSAGQMTTTCTIKLTPIKDKDGKDAVEEVTTCKVAMNGTNNGANGSGDASSASQGGSSSTSASGAASTDSSAGSGSSAAGSSSSDSSGSSSSAASAASSSAAPAASGSASGGAAAPVKANGVSSIPKADIQSLLPSGSGAAASASTTAASSGASASGAGAQAGSVSQVPASAASGASGGSPTAAAQSTAQSASAAAAQDSSSASPSAAGSFELPGKKLSVLPIGLGVFAGISVIALIVVGLVTYERTKYRKAFRQRKLAEQGAAMGYSGNMAERT